MPENHLNRVLLACGFVHAQFAVAVAAGAQEILQHILIEEVASVAIEGVHWRHHGLLVNGAVLQQTGRNVAEAATASFTQSVVI